MKHLGDITQIDGHKVPIADVIIGGSPCQDLSVAGKRAGLEGERSGLFMEQIRIIKEMRDEDIRRGWADELVRPRWGIWENVPGALSANGGEDFRIVLEEFCKVKDPNAVVPRPKNGKWGTCGCIVGNGYSVCYRVLDLQYWGPTYFDDDGVPIKLGTPQRRRRIALVADFNTEWGAPEVLLERGGLPGDITESRNKGQGIADSSEESLRESGISFQERAGKPGGGKGILTQVGHIGAMVAGNSQAVVEPSYGLTIGETTRFGVNPRKEHAPTMRCNNSGDNMLSVIEPQKDD